jgi:hypothetical protein
MIHLDEISEKDATGIVADIYKDIRRRLGLPVVNFIYRHLATKPELFKEIWSAIVESLDNGDITKSATEYMATMNASWIKPLPEIFLEECGIDEDERLIAFNTLKVYERANKINAVIIVHLLSNNESQEIDRPHTSGKLQSQSGESAMEQILPMQDLALLSPRKVEMLDALTNITVGRQPGIPVVPSLFRHFAHNSSLMTSFWVALSSTESREKLVIWEKALKQRTKEDAFRMKGPRIKLDTETIKVLEAFSNTIILRMLGTGRILERLMSGEAMNGQATSFQTETVK